MVFCKRYPEEKDIYELLNKLHYNSIGPHPIEQDDHLRILKAMKKDEFNECDFYVMIKNEIERIRFIEYDEYYLIHLLNKS